MGTAASCLRQLRFFMTMLIMVAAVSFSAGTIPIDCGSDEIPRALLDELYDYALLAEFAFVPKSAATCEVDDKEHYFAASWKPDKIFPFSAKTLTPDQVRNYLEGFKDPAVAYVVKDKYGNAVDDNYHLSCFDKTVIPQLAVRLVQYMRVVPRSSSTISSATILVGGPQEESGPQEVEKPRILDKIRHAIITVFEVSFILPRSVIEDLVNLVPEGHRSHVRAILDGEGLENAHLHRVATAPSVNANDVHKEDIYLIRGTQFLNPAQVLQHIRASLNYSMNETCVFKVAALVAGNISMIYGNDSDRFVALGHSLGGAVAQHIAKDYATNPNNYSSTSDFVAFSYNAVGLKDPPVEPLGILNSYCTDGDFACFIGSKVHEQAGTMITYYPADGGGPFSNHTIRQVQKSLCKCKAGEGSLQVVESQKARVAHTESKRR